MHLPFMVAGEFLTDVVAVIVFEAGGPVGSVRDDSFAKGHEITSSDHLAEGIGYNSRAADLVGCRVAGRNYFMRPSIDTLAIVGQYPDHLRMVRPLHNFRPCPVSSPMETNSRILYRRLLFQACSEYFPRQRT